MLSGRVYFSFVTDALSLSHKYFEEIVSGHKVAAYRADTKYWKARLLKEPVSAISFRNGGVSAAKSSPTKG